MTHMLLDKIKVSKSKSETVIQVQCLSLMAKYVGSKLAPFLGEIIPLL